MIGNPKEPLKKFLDLINEFSKVVGQFLTMTVRFAQKLERVCGKSTLALPQCPRVGAVVSAGTMLSCVSCMESCAAGRRAGLQQLRRQLGPQHSEFSKPSFSQPQRYEV